MSAWTSQDSVSLKQNSTNKMESTFFLRPVHSVLLSLSFSPKSNISYDFVRFCFFSKSMAVDALVGTVRPGPHRMVFSGLENDRLEQPYYISPKTYEKSLKCHTYFLAGEPSLCYRYEGDGICEPFEKETSIIDCGLHTPEGHLDQWATQAYSYHEDKKKCPASLVTGEPHSMVSEDR